MKHEILQGIKPLGDNPDDTVPVWEPKPWKMTDLGKPDEAYRCVNGIALGVLLGTAIWAIFFFVVWVLLP
jgi:hypothetical protein